jgi:hypothetical protein
VSKYDKKPTRASRLDIEIQSVHKALNQLDALSAKTKIFCAGNHEDRLERYLVTKAPELFGLVKVEELFKLKERGWKYIPYKHHYALGKINVTHDVGNAGAQAHIKAQNSFQSNIVMGHTHRMAYAITGNATGGSHVAAMLGWLGDVGKIDYMYKISAKQNWTLGFGIGYQCSNGVTHVVPVPIVKYGCIIEGIYFFI